MRHWSEDTNWQRLSEVVERLKRRVEDAYFRSDEARAEQAHDDLLSAEWRLRQAEKRQKP